MSWPWIVFASIILLQLVTGWTIGPEQFRDFGTSIGRWPRLVRRDEEPTFFWVIISCQILLVLMRAF
jgi:hypothetical protein